MVLAFFATSDGIVFDNIDMNFSNEVQITEAKFFYGMQCFMENIHSQVYMALLKYYVKDTQQQKKLIDAIHNVKCIKEKADWALSHFSSDVPFAKRLIAAVCLSRSMRLYHIGNNWHGNLNKFN